jgi:hypothetical protein
LHIATYLMLAYPARSALFKAVTITYFYFICRLSFDRVPSAKYYYSYVVLNTTGFEWTLALGYTSPQARIEALHGRHVCWCVTMMPPNTKQRSWYSRAWILNTKLKKTTIESLRSLSVERMIFLFNLHNL